MSPDRLIPTASGSDLIHIAMPQQQQQQGQQGQADQSGAVWRRRCSVKTNSQQGSGTLSKRQPVRHSALTHSPLHQARLWAAGPIILLLCVLLPALLQPCSALTHASDAGPGSDGMQHMKTSQHTQQSYVQPECVYSDADGLCSAISSSPTSSPEQVAAPKVAADVKFLNPEGSITSMLAAPFEHDPAGSAAGAPNRMGAQLSNADISGLLAALLQRSVDDTQASRPADGTRPQAFDASRQQESSQPLPLPQQQQQQQLQQQLQQQMLVGAGSRAVDRQEFSNALQRLTSQLHAPAGGGSQALTFVAGKGGADDEEEVDEEQNGLMQLQLLGALLRGLHNEAQWHQMRYVRRGNAAASSSSICDSSRDGSISGTTSSTGLCLPRSAKSAGISAHESVTCTGQGAHTVCTPGNTPTPFQTIKHVSVWHAPKLAPGVAVAWPPKVAANITTRLVARLLAKAMQLQVRELNQAVAAVHKQAAVAGQAAQTAAAAAADAAGMAADAVDAAAATRRWIKRAKVLLRKAEQASSRSHMQYSFDHQAGGEDNNEADQALDDDPLSMLGGRPRRSLLQAAFALNLNTPFLGFSSDFQIQAVLTLALQRELDASGFTQSSNSARVSTFRGARFPFGVDFSVTDILGGAVKNYYGFTTQTDQERAIGDGSADGRGFGVVPDGDTNVVLGVLSSSLAKRAIIDVDKTQDKEERDQRLNARECRLRIIWATQDNRTRAQNQARDDRQRASFAVLGGRQGLQGSYGKALQKQNFDQQQQNKQDLPSPRNIPPVNVSGLNFSACDGLDPRRPNSTSQGGGRRRRQGKGRDPRQDGDRELTDEEYWEQYDKEQEEYEEEYELRRDERLKKEGEQGGQLKSSVPGGEGNVTLSATGLGLRSSRARRAISDSADGLLGADLSDYAPDGYEALLEDSNEDGKSDLQYERVRRERDPATALYEYMNAYEGNFYMLDYNLMNSWLEAYYEDDYEASTDTTATAAPANATAAGLPATATSTAAAADAPAPEGTRGLSTGSVAETGAEAAAAPLLHISDGSDSSDSDGSGSSGRRPGDNGQNNNNDDNDGNDNNNDVDRESSRSFSSIINNNLSLGAFSNQVNISNVNRTLLAIERARRQAILNVLFGNPRTLPPRFIPQRRSNATLPRAFIRQTPLTPFEVALATTLEYSRAGQYNYFYTDYARFATSYYTAPAIVPQTSVAALRTTSESRRNFRAVTGGSSMGQASGVNIATVSQSLSGAIRGIAQPTRQSDLFGNISFIATPPQQPTRYAGAAASGVAFGRGYFFQAPSTTQLITSATAAVDPAAVGAGATGFVIGYSSGTKYAGVRSQVLAQTGTENIDWDIVLGRRRGT